MFLARESGGRQAWNRPPTGRCGGGSPSSPGPARESARPRRKRSPTLAPPSSSPRATPPPCSRSRRGSRPVAGKVVSIGRARVAALDYADRGIRGNVAAPGTILTHHLEAAGAEAQRLAALAAPMRRIGSASEVARVVVWLSSPGSSYLTGAVIPIDGGQSAGVKPPQMYRQGQPMQAEVPVAVALAVQHRGEVEDPLHVLVSGAEPGRVDKWLNPLPGARVRP